MKNELEKLIDQEVLNSIAHQLMDVRGEIRELQALEETLTDKIKASMVERGEEVITGDNWKASWKVANVSRFDSKAFKEDHKDLYDAYVKASATTRFLFNA